MCRNIDRISSIEASQDETIILKIARITDYRPLYVVRMKALGKWCCPTTSRGLICHQSTDFTPSVVCPSSSNFIGWRVAGIYANEFPSPWRYDVSSQRSVIAFLTWAAPFCRLLTSGQQSADDTAEWMLVTGHTWLPLQGWPYLIVQTEFGRTLMHPDNYLTSDCPRTKGHRLTPFGRS